MSGNAAAKVAIMAMVDFSIAVLNSTWKWLFFYTNPYSETPTLERSIRREIESAMLVSVAADSRACGTGRCAAARPAALVCELFGQRGRLALCGTGVARAR